MITLSDVRMQFGSQVLFEHVSWQLSPDGHYGLVGANGTGKSTLLRMMAGEVRPEGGTLAIPNDLRIGTLGQDHFRYDRERLLDVVLMGKPALWEALREKDALLAEVAAADGHTAEATGHRLAELEAAIADLHGYEAEPKAGALLEGLGLPAPRHGEPMRALSGGYRLRVLLAQCLFGDPDLLLLDEPTNHLDIVSIRWLESYLREFPGAFVVVSHDRHFLNAICTTIADLDYQELRLYPGDYDAFEAGKALASEQREVEIARAEEKIAETQKFIDRFRAKATKARQAQSRKKQVERMQEALPEVKRSSRRYPAFRFDQVRSSGKEVLAVKHLAKAYGDARVLDDVSFTLGRGERLAVVGPNGVGKSTLVKCIAGALTPDAGAVEPGYEVHPGYFAQDHHEVLRGNTSVYEWLYSLSPGESVSAIRGTLGKVLFSGDDVDKRLSALSGGEAARLLLAGLMLRRPNLLLLDEPTNHLDLEGREALMEALRHYEGTLVFVSHDRHFVSHVANRVLALSWDGLEDFAGDYERYLAKQGADYLDASLAAPRRSGGDEAASRGGAARQQDFAERKERKRAASRLRKRVERLEAEVTRLESELETTAERFAADGYYQDTPWEQVEREQAEQQARQRRLEAAMGEWEQAASELEAVQEAS